MRVIDGRTSDGLDAAMSLFQLNWCAKFGARDIDYDWYRKKDHDMGSQDNVVIGLWWTDVSEWMRRAIWETVGGEEVDSALGSEGWRRKEYRHLFAAVEARSADVVFEGDFQLLVCAPEWRRQSEAYSVSSMSFKIGKA